MKYRTPAERRALRLSCELVHGDFDIETAAEVDKQGSFIDPSSTKFRLALEAHWKARRESAEKE